MSKKNNTEARKTAMKDISEESVCNYVNKEKKIICNDCKEYKCKR